MNLKNRYPIFTPVRLPVERGGVVIVYPGKHSGLLYRAVARALIEGGCIFIYSGSARLVSFEIKLISKEVIPGRTRIYEYTPPPLQLAF